MNKWICLVSLLLVTGCTTARFRPYVGNQQAWPTGEGTIVNVRYELPIFTSLPPVPYEVLGEIRADSPIRALPEAGDMAAVSQKAKQIGADAILFVQGRIFFSTNYGRTSSENATASTAPTLTQVNTFNPDSFEPGVTMLAIHWSSAPPPGLKRAIKQADAPAPKAQAPATKPAPAPTKTNFTPRPPGE